MIHFFHSSDWHLGKTLFAQSLIEDQKVALRELLAEIEQKKPEFLIIAGDIFDRSVPPENAIALFDDFLNETILRLKTPIAMIPGNHDSNTRVGFNASLLRAAGLHIFSSPQSAFTPWRIEKNNVKIAVYGIPFLEPAEWGFFFGEELKTHEEALGKILQKLLPELEKDKADQRRTILILHAAVCGGESSDSERPLSIGGSELVSHEHFKHFDYVALGHLHRPQSMGAKHIRYPGSLLSYSASESAQAKGFVHVELGSNSQHDRFEFKPFQKVRKLYAITGSFNELLTRPPIDDYVIATVTDASLPFESFRQLQLIYPRLLHVSRDLNWSRSDAQATKTVQIASSQDDSDILSEFLNAAVVGEIDAADRDWLFSEFELFSSAQS